MLDDPAEVEAQVVRLVGQGGVATLCIHGDDPRAVRNADLVLAALSRNGIAPEELRPTMMGLAVINPGLATTVQDEGRVGWRAWGVPVGGPSTGPRPRWPMPWWATRRAARSWS